MMIPMRPVSTAFAADAPASGTAPRTLKVRVLRYNPQQPAVAPHWQTYELVDAAGMTLLLR